MVKISHYCGDDGICWVEGEGENGKRFRLPASTMKDLERVEFAVRAHFDSPKPNVPTEVNTLKRRMIIVKWQIGLGYGVLGMFGMGLVIAKTVQDIFLSINIGIPMVMLYPAGVLTLWLVGFIYDRGGWYSIESSYGFERNEYMERRFPKVSEKKD
jgi:hypothetical protein